MQHCSTHWKGIELNDFVNASSPPSGNFTLESQDEGELVCTWSAWNEPLLAIIPPCCGQVSFPGSNGEYGSPLPQGVRFFWGGVPCGFKAPFACGENGKSQICKDSEISEAIVKMNGPFKSLADGHTSIKLKRKA